MYTGHVILYSGKCEICEQFLEACIIFCVVQIEAHSDHTSLLSLPAMLAARLPLQSNAVITTGGGLANTNKFAKHNSAITGSNCGSCSLEALEGVAIHITPTVNSARIVLLFR